MTNTYIHTYTHTLTHTHTFSRQGLLGIAFHPNFVANGRLFVSYTCAAGAPDCAADGVLTVYEYYFNPENTRNPTQLGNPISYRKIIEFIGEEREVNNHNGGQLLFKPWPIMDPILYIITGDTGTGGGPSQDLNSLLGKVLRINVDSGFDPNTETYGIPNDNPFVNTPGARPEVYAWGLRNVWRCSFDSARPNDYFMCGE